MKKYFIFLVISFILINKLDVFSVPDDTKDFAFIADVRIDSINNQINFIWQADTNARMYYIKRKLKADKDFPPEYYAELTADASSFTDSAVSRGTSYEYGFEKWCGKYSAWNYFNAGWDLPPVISRGTLLLLVDSTMAMVLSEELNRLALDITGDGWLVILKKAPRATDFDKAKMERTKNIILDVYNKSNGNLRSVLLLGRVPVPFAGDYAIDGHDPDHKGAWPADTYYADIDGNWTDSIVSSDLSNYSHQFNYPFDGKFDNSSIPSDVDLELGRIDFFDLPAFKDSEIELMRNYLRKNHEYRTKIISYEQNAVIDDKFKTYSNEEFASAAWLNFSALMPIANIDTASIRQHLLTNRYLFSYGCNSGGINSCYLVGYTSEFPDNPPQSAIYTALGSYFGDWFFPDNFLRAALASHEAVIASFWLGRPFWHLHHLGLGETLGYSTKISQNNLLTYESTSKYGNRMPHIELLGDPTLRIHILEPPSDLEIVNLAENRIKLKWNAPIDAPFGYIVLRSGSFNEPFELIPSLQQGTEYIDSLPLLGENIYQVRAVKEEHTPTGSYWNNSTGIFGSVKFPVIASTKKLSIFAAPNPASRFTTLAINSKIDGNVHISLFDAIGKKINSWINKTSVPGLSTIDLELTDGAGTYLARGSYIIFATDGEGHSDSFKIIIK